MLQTIKKLGELAYMIEEEKGIKLSFGECAAIASMFKNGIDGAIHTFDDYGFYHFSALFIWENEIEFENVKKNIFKYCAECILDWLDHYPNDDCKINESIVTALLNTLFNSYSKSETITEKLEKMFIDAYKVFCGAESYENDCRVMSTYYNDKNYIVMDFDKR